METMMEMTMAEAQSFLSEDELNHHGILGMKWGIRRFQKYPAGYSGDGRYVGPDGQPRKPTWREARRDRKYNELKTKIDKWLVDAVETGDKKTLKGLKKTMSPQEYQSAYDALVKKGVGDAVKSGDKKELKKYKDDLSKREYKDAQTLSDFNDAVNNMDTDRMNKLVGKIKNEEVREAAQRIATMTEFQNKKIGALKVESEMSAKLYKAANTAANVAKIATSVKSVYDAVSGVKKSMEDRQYEQQKRADEINKKNEKEAIEKAINSGDAVKIKKLQNKMSNQQLKDAYERLYLNDKDKIDRSILTEDSLAKIKKAGLLSYADIEKLNKAKDDDVKYKAPKWSKEVQDSKKKDRDAAAEALGKIQQENSTLYNKILGKDESVLDFQKRKADPSLQAAYEKERKNNLDRYERTSAVEWAASIIYNKADADYNSYKGSDPTGQTWKDALSKKSSDMKSTFGDLVDNIKLTPKAKEAKKQAEAAAEKLKNQDLSAATKIMDAFNKNGEKFLDGSVPFIDPRKFNK